MRANCPWRGAGGCRHFPLLPLLPSVSVLLLGPSLTMSSARGDVVFYRLPTRGGGVVTLEGTTTVNPGGTVTFQHSRFGKVYFDLASVEIKKAPPLTAQFKRMLGPGRQRCGKADGGGPVGAAKWPLAAVLYSRR